MKTPNSQQIDEVLLPDSKEYIDDDQGYLCRFRASKWTVQYSFSDLHESVRVLIVEDEVVISDCYLESVQSIRIVDQAGIVGIEASGRLGDCNIMCMLQIRPTVSLMIRGLKD